MPAPNTAQQSNVRIDRQVEIHILQVEDPLSEGEAHTPGGAARLV